MTPSQHDRMNDVQLVNLIWRLWESYRQTEYKQGAAHRRRFVGEELSAALRELRLRGEQTRLW